VPRQITKFRMVRRSRAMWGSRRVWQPSLVFWAGAIAIGLISVLFAVLADKAQALFQQLTGDGEGWRSYLPLALTPLGFVLCAWLAYVFFLGLQGSGIPQAIAARHLRDDKDRSHILSLRLVMGKIALTVVGLFCGASIGREGPTVQVGGIADAAGGAVGRHGASARPDPRRFCRRYCGRLQHAARRHRLRHRGEVY
jgi:H+/Cl- antiporter ClcA